MKIQVTENGCWEWTGARNRHGYGVMRHKGSVRLTHRIMWIEIYGDPGDLLVCHSCDNPPCCNPAHLFIGTHADNIADMMTKGRHGHGRLRGEDHPSTRITDREVEEMRELHHQGLTQREIAEIYEVSPTHMSRIIRGLSREVMV